MGKHRLSFRHYSRHRSSDSFEMSDNYGTVLGAYYYTSAYSDWFLYSDINSQNVLLKKMILELSCTAPSFFS